MDRRPRWRRWLALALGTVAVAALLVTGTTTTVPDVIGVDTSTALGMLDSAGLSGLPHIDGAGDTVVRVYPEVGTRVMRSTKVELIFGEARDLG